MSYPYQTPDPYGGQQHNPYAGGGGQPGYGYPQQPQGYGYPQQGYGGYPPPGPTGEQNQLAMASVVIGFISVIGAFFCYGGLLGPVGIGIGIAGLNRSKRTGTGRNQSIGGIALSALGTLILVVVGVIYYAALNKYQ